MTIGSRSNGGRRRFAHWFGILAAAFLVATLPAKQASAQDSAADAAIEFTNPVSKFPFFIMENDTFLLNGDVTDKDRWGNVHVIEPVLPVPLGDTGWTSINRFILPIVTTVDVPLPGGTGGGVGNNPNVAPTAPGIFFDDKAGLGDLTVFSLFSPPNEGRGFIWGVGPTMKFPIATNDAFASDKFQAGPAGVFLYADPKFTVGVLAQHWWDFAGKSSAADVSLTNIQYFYSIPLNEKWSIGAGPIITINHEAGKGDKWSIPIGTGLAYQTTLFGRPTRILGEIDYYVEQLDTYGPEWQFRLLMGVMLPPVFGG